MIRFPGLRLILKPLSRYALNKARCMAALTNNGLLRFQARYYGTDIEKIKQETDANDTDTSASTTGVVDVDKTKEVLLYFDHIYGRSVSRFKTTQYLNLLIPDKTPEELKEEVIKMAQSENKPLPESTSIVDFVPLKRDAGAFVKFSVPLTVTPKELIGLICDNVKTNRENDSKSFSYYFRGLFRSYPSVYEVKGTPWIEDLRRFPSVKLKVKFEGEPLTEEELYVLFRRYGSIIDIIPSSSSVPHAEILFKRLRAGICAKNCITGIELNGGKTTLHLQYIPIERVNYVANFISNHQRIAIPVILALLATAAVLIFDPIRLFFIKEKIEHKLSLQHYKENRYVKFLVGPILTLRSWLFSGYDYIGETLNAKCHEEYVSNESDYDAPQNVDANNLWVERTEKVKQLKLWIYENVNTFIVVRGPKGSGKKELVVEHTLMEDEKLRNKILYFDCDEVVKSRSERTLIEAIANQIGYYPVFSWLSSISQFVDLGVQGLTGQKSGLSESKETQVKNMFLLTTQALRSVASEDYEQYEKVARARIRRQQLKKNLKPGSEVKVDELMKAEEYLQQHPETKPIIVINKFASKSRNDANEFFYKLLSDWAASVIQSNLAHVIFITNDVGSVLLLNMSLPNQVFKLISLNDASEAGSFQYVMNQLRDMRYEKLNPDIIKEVLKPLGGRMLDLQSFIRRIKSGETPHESLDEMVTQAAEQITSFFLFNNTKPGDDDYKNWDPLQVWELMRLLSKSESVDYNTLTKSPLFKPGNDTSATLSALEKNDLITLKRKKGMLNEITTGRPIYRAAFKSLVEDEEICKNFEKNLYNNLVKLETSKIQVYEDELSKFPMKEYKLDNRIKYLIDKIEASNEKIVQYESIIKDLTGGTKKSSSFLGVF